ncbi:DNA-3-methyladenine glycosylase 2 family protein [Pollutibacter soli]|uniref:DNA-3-methyladenine glycosylase family protein n=1 Tax=Pollutibacter soli TaxID=3034157 RepID=UPI0030134EFB
MHYLPHLEKDRRLKKIMDSHGPLKLRKQKDLCNYLCASIMSQQLSTKVASVIHGRYIELFGGKEPEPQRIIDTPHEKLRAIGLSNAKVSYVKNVAEFAIVKGMSHDKLHPMTDDEVIAYLTEIKGVGRWTVEMLLMFALQREDVFPVDDLGIRQAIAGIYKIKTGDKKELTEAMYRIAKKWSPYRTYASMYLWRWKDTLNV